MKRIITFIILAGVSLSAFAQSDTMAPVKAFYASDAWNKAFMGYFGVNSGTEPGIPEDDAEREVLGQIRDLLQSGTDADLNAAIAAITALVQQQRQENINTSPMMLQIAGTLAMRAADLTSDQTQRTLYLTRAEAFLKQSVDPTTGFPNFLRAHKNLANLLFRQDKPKEAKVHFVKAIELGDRDAVTFGLLGAIYLDESKLISAESALRNSLMINQKFTKCFSTNK